MCSRLRKFVVLVSMDQIRDLERELESNDLIGIILKTFFFVLYIVITLSCHCALHRIIDILIRTA
jgi:hypothetical protein